MSDERPVLLTHESVSYLMGRTEATQLILAHAVAFLASGQSLTTDVFKLLSDHPPKLVWGGRAAERESFELGIKDGLDSFVESLSRYE